MKFVTNEYTRLVKDNDEVVIKPNIEFESIPAGYKVTAYAVIKNEKGAVVAILKPGSITEELKKEPILSQLPLKDLRELARSRNIAFSTRTTIKEFIRLLEA